MQSFQGQTRLQTNPSTKQDSNSDTRPNKRVRHNERTRSSYRLRGIHESFDLASLESALCSHFGIEKDRITIHSLAYDAPYSHSFRQKVATITFQTIPEMLKAGNRWQVKILLPRGSEELCTVYFDTTFEGFTPLTAAEQEDNTRIDCILIHGWAGHSIGSFSSPDGDWFWPRDSLCHEIPQLRIWLYGYPSDLRDSGSITDVYEYADTFGRALADARKSAGESKAASRPLIYIVHSLGGYILQETISKMADSDHIDDKINLSMTKGALLFGVPNQGMESQQLMNLLHEDDLPAVYTASLLDERYGFKLRVNQVYDFYKACSRNNTTVYTFYETEKTPTVCRDAETQRWTRNGPPALLVSQSSATCACPEQRNMIPWKSGHNDMLKLRRDDVQYETLLGRLREIVQRIESNQAADQVTHSMSTGFDISEAIHEADKLIHNHYRSSDRLCIQRLSGQILELENCYINLALIDRSGGMKSHGQKTPFSPDVHLRLDAAHIGQSISLDDLFTSRKLADGKVILPRRIFIQGRAGIGKTTLCKKIVHEFLEERLEPALFDRLIWIPLRGLHAKQEEYGWRELLSDTLQLISPRWKAIKDIYSKQLYDVKFLSRTLFLFDGLDEVSHRWQKDDLMFNFLNTVLREIPNMIITSRPQVNTFRIEQFDLDLETVGFTRDQVGIYIRNCVEDAEVIARMEKAIASRPLIQSLLRIPIQLDAFCYVWTDMDQYSGESIGKDHQNVTDIFGFDTMTALYQSIVIELCKKDLRKLGDANYGLQLTSSEVLYKFEKELDLLGEIAFQGLYSNIADFNPRHWYKLGDHFYDSRREFSNIFSASLERFSFLRTSDHGKDYTRRNYHFIHLTFQEFFAAKHFVKYWKHEIPLTCLDLTSVSDWKTTMPFAFLQEEKYNPRYNIFWRFVAGLISMKYDTVKFFSQLHDKPVDLLGGAHLRLIMYCFSEVVQDQKVQGLCDREVISLNRGLIQEYHITGEAMLGTAVEFPEQLLCKFLQHDLELPCIETLSILEQRSMLQIHTIAAVDHKLDPNYTMEIRIQAAKTLLMHFSFCSHHVTERAVEVLRRVLENEDVNLRESAVRALSCQSTLPDSAVDTLLLALRDEDKFVRKIAANAVEGLSALPESAIHPLITAYKNEDIHIQYSIYNALRNYQSPLVQSAIDYLVSLMRDGYRAYYILDVLRLQPYLLESAIDAVATVLPGEDPQSREVAIDTLAKQSSLSTSALMTLVAVLDDKIPYIRAVAAIVLERQPSLPESVAAALDQRKFSSGSDVTSLDAISLSDEPFLPDESSQSNRLIEALESSDVDLRHWAVTILMRNSSLSTKATNALITAVKTDEDYIIREYAGSALGKQSSISDEIIDALIVTLQDKKRSVRFSAVGALGNQSTLPERAIRPLITALKDKLLRIRIFAAKALAKHSPLSEDAVATLLRMLANEDQDKDEDNDKETSDDEEDYNCRENDYEKDVDYRICDILTDQKLFYYEIANLTKQGWRKIWSFWIRNGQNKYLSCYVLHGALYVWSNEQCHQISTYPDQTFGLLKVVLEISDDELWRKVAVIPASVRDITSATQDNAEIASDPRPAKRARIWCHFTNMRLKGSASCETWSSKGKEAVD